MNNKRRVFCSRTVFRWCGALMLLVFLPVLYCVLTIGNNMDYWEFIKQKHLLYSTQVLGLCAFLGAAVLLWLLYFCRSLQISRRGNLILNLVLLGVFLGIYFLNLTVSREIAYKLPWDIMVVRGCGYYAGIGKPLEYYTYLSVYPNNIPISYFLGRIYRSVLEGGSFPYVADYAWIQVGCAFTSVAGFFSCLTVKKLTKKLLPTVVSFFVIFLLVECSAWKMVPYTDTYALPFAVMAVYFYILSREDNRERGGKLLKEGFVEARRYFCLILSLVCAVAGGLIKPSVYVVMIAVTGMEFFRLLGEKPGKWLLFPAELLFVTALLWGSGKYKEHMIEYLGLEYNQEISAGWQHYFMMGLNDATTGGYNADDNVIFGEFQHEKREVRNRAELERALKRLGEKGFPGALYFYLKKMVMTFNDGQFGWGTETRVDGYYEGEENLASQTERTGLLRSIYWEGRWTGAYNTLCQLAWYVVLLGLPGICLSKRRNGGHDILVISFLGIFFYQMLFEARARYLFVFVPVLIAASVCGYERYAELVCSLVRKRKSCRAVKPFKAPGL